MKKSNFYLLYSDDVSLLNNEVLKLKNSLNISDESIYYDIDNISNIVVEASTVGMFNPYKFIVIDCSSYKDIDISLLEDYFKSYNVNSYLIFIYKGTIDSRKKLFKLISDNGIVMKLDISNDYLNDFVNDYLKKNNYRMEGTTISYFLSRCGNNIDNIKNELDKLMLYKIDDKIISNDDISLLIQESSDDSVFELVSAFLKNDGKKAMKLYYNFIDEGMDISQIVAIIASQIRLLFQVKRLYNEGKSNDEIAKILEFRSVYRVKHLLNDAYLYSENDLVKYLSNLADIDKAIKTGTMDGKVLLELFIAKKDM
mgnify:FL=1